ncbi:hypothetical protein BJ912DRAFT_927001 [Pholiota molesta]|nr:hypothetical protein BJ912DRAFT_927001 [Pholiota molesta]
MPVISSTTISVTSLLASTSNLCLSYILPVRSRPPISRIPAEVLQEIFLFTLLSPSDSDAIFSPGTYTPIISESSSATPFPLSNVNRQWRDIINNTPALWRSITVVAPHPNLLYRAELWLERSRNYSLDIAIMQYHITEEISDATDKLLAMFAVHKARWRSVNFLFHLGISPAVTNTLVDLQHLPRSRLQDATISSGDDDDARGPPGCNADAVYKALQGIPTLRKLSWKSSYITPHARFGAQLQFLELESPICIKELADNVARCPNLIYLSAHHILASTSLERRSLPIVLSNLVVLILTMAMLPGAAPAGALSFVPFLERFAVPSLAQLQLKNITDHPDDADDDAAPRPNTRTAVQALLQRSQCHLKSLNVHILDAPAAEVRAWMNTTGIDAVEMLCVSGAEIDDTVLEMLTREHGDFAARGRFPHLKQLGLSLCEESVDEGVLLRMLGSRFWTPVSVVRSAVDDPRKRQELLSAHVWVSECTPNMMKYEKMINMCAERIREWKREGRELRFTVAR